MSNVKFSPRQLLFLELFFSGLSMKDAATGAGYKGKTPQALCNTGRAILAKFSTNPQALFRFAGARERKIARLLVDMAKGSKPGRALIALEILSKCLNK